MKPGTEAEFAEVLDRRLRRRNDRLRAHLVAWSDVLGALGWCVAVRDAAGRPQLNAGARADLPDDATLVSSWDELEGFLASGAQRLRPVQTADVQVWGRPAPAAPVASPQAAGLTRRETEVLAWLREGKSGPEIAMILGCAARTVERHVANIYRKLGVRTRAGLLPRPV